MYSQNVCNYEFVHAIAFPIVAIVGLQGLLTTVTEGEGSARVGISVLEGGLSQSILVRLLTVDINATCKFFIHEKPITIPVVAIVTSLWNSG